MRLRRCVRCAREVYIVNDPQGNPETLDATAPVFRVDVDDQNVETAVHEARGYVGHELVCPAPAAREVTPT